MFYLNYFYPLFLFLFLIACGTNKGNVENVMTENQTEPSKSDTIPKAYIVEKFDNSPQTTINSAEIKGNILLLNVSYSGGCEEQEFDLVGATFVMKSLPPKRKIKLIRDSKGDACREWISKDLVYNIQAFVHDNKPESEIILLLDGFEKEISYIFSSK